MNFLNKMERKFGRRAIHNLSAYIIALYAAGYVLLLFSPEIIGYLTLEPGLILRGQVWRLLTWIIVPPSGLDIFTIIMLFFYYSIGNTLERTWGAFRYNVYIFSGIIATAIGAFLLYFILGGNILFGSALFSTYYINMSIFLAFAAMYPEMQVMLYFLIPIKVKWMGIVYGVFILYSFVKSSWVGRAAIIASLFNFIVFFMMTRNFKKVSPGEINRRRKYKQAASRPKGVTKHKCAVCGRTELDGDNLEFRFCSKCEGNYEYCQDHLFNHIHKNRQ